MYCPYPLPLPPPKAPKRDGPNVTRARRPSKVKARIARLKKEKKSIIVRHWISWYVI